MDDRGVPVPTDAVGNIAVRSPDPVMFLGYWNNPSATAGKFAGAYLLTGDLGCMDADGFIHYVGRNDDVITSAGYRIGPGPIEDCLLGHPAVRLVAVVGVPDPIRTEVVKAFVVLADGFTASESLTQELQNHVRTRLAACRTQTQTTGGVQASDMSRSATGAATAATTSRGMTTRGCPAPPRPR